METVFKGDCQSERWIKREQLALTIDEVSAFTALTFSLDPKNLSEEDRDWDQNLIPW